MPLTELQIYFWPRMTLTFDHLTPWVAVSRPFLEDHFNVPISINRFHNTAIISLVTDKWKNKWTGLRT